MGTSWKDATLNTQRVHQLLSGWKPAHLCAAKATLVKTHNMASQPSTSCHAQDLPRLDLEDGKYLASNLHRQFYQGKKVSAWSPENWFISKKSFQRHSIFFSRGNGWEFFKGGRLLKTEQMTHTPKIAPGWIYLKHIGWMQKKHPQDRIYGHTNRDASGRKPRRWIIMDNMHLGKLLYWLVVSTPLKKYESQWEGLSHI